MGLKMINKENIINFNGIDYQYGKLLLNYIYTDYSELIDYIEKELSNYIYNINNDISKLSLGEINLFFDKITECNPLLEKNSNDPFFLIFLYELNTIRYELSPDIDFTKIINNIKMHIKKLINLQDLYYEAFNICFNDSNLSLNKLSVDERILYYYHLQYSINVINNIPENSKFSSKIEYIENINNINKNLFDNDETYIDNNLELYPVSTNTSFRKNMVTYNKKTNEILCSHKPNYTLPENKFHIKENIVNSELHEVLNFCNLTSLCCFEFNNLILNRNNFKIQECKLCTKLFIKKIKSTKEYCDNLFSDSNKPCSKIGAGIINKINDKNIKLTKLDKIVYDKYKKRLSPLDKKALNFLKETKKLKEDVITISEYETVLKYFNGLKPNKFKESLLPDNLKSIYNRVENK